MRSSRRVLEGLGVAVATPGTNAPRPRPASRTGRDGQRWVASERGGVYTAGVGAVGDVSAVVAEADEQTLGGALASLPPTRLARVLGAAVAPLARETAAAALRAAAAHLDDRAALAVCEELAGTWASEELLSLSEAVIGRLGERTLGGAVTDEALHDSVARLQRLATRTEAEKLRRVREVAQRRSHLGAGARRPADLLTRLGLTNGEARQQEDMANRLAELPKTGDALAKGRIGLGQAAEAAKALAAAKAAHARDGDGDGGGEGTGGGEGGEDGQGDGTGQGARGRAEAERDAIDEAVSSGRAGSDRRQTREELERLAARGSRNRLAEAERRAYRKRHGRKFREGDSLTIKLSGPGAATQKIWTMIQALARPKEAGEDRSQEQRNYDAAVEIADRYLAEGTLPEVAGLPAQVLLIGSHDAFHGIEGAEPAIVDGFGPVSSETAKMLCCQAELHVVITGGDGEPLRVGRMRYQPNRAQRRAVLARDKGCVGCGAPAARCQIHHIWWWRHGGRTDISNLVLLCANCHTHVHHFGWVVTRDDDGRYHAGPPSDQPPAGEPPEGGPPAGGPPVGTSPGCGPRECGPSTDAASPEPLQPATDAASPKPTQPPATGRPTALSLLDPPAVETSAPAPAPAKTASRRRRTR